MFIENFGDSLLKVGSIEVVCGSMFSGKTEELIRRIKRAQFAHQRVKIFKPAMENRYDEKDVVSHDSNQIASIPIKHSKQILGQVHNAEVVGIDEGQFFDMDLPEVCNQLANNGIRVIVAGLDMDYLGNPFGPMPNLLAIAEYVTKVHAVCMRTGKLAQYSHRIEGHDQQVQLGAGDTYEPLSREAFLLARREEEVSKKQHKLFDQKEGDASEK